MTLLIKAAMKERDLLEAENQSLQELVDDPEFPELNKAQADLRLQCNRNSLAMMDGMIARLLEKQPIDNVLNDINNNLSTQDH